MEPLQIINNENKLRFETNIGGEYAFIEYRWYKGDIALMHTFTPETARGKGVSSQLAEFALNYIRDKNLKMIVYCPFVSKYIKSHPEYEVLIDREYRQ